MAKTGYILSISVAWVSFICKGMLIVKVLLKKEINERRRSNRCKETKGSHGRVPAQIRKGAREPTYNRAKKYSTLKEN